MRLESRCLAAKATLLLVCAAMITWAQSTSEIHGTVHDASGAAVAGAIVRVIQTDTGTVRAVSTDQNGVYVLTNLPIGPYQLKTSKDGFTKSYKLESCGR